MNNLIINEEIMQGNPVQLQSYIKKEIANQILSMDYKTIENTCYNMRLFADVFELLEEHINDEIITLKYNPMGSWYIDEEEQEEYKRACSHCDKHMKEGYCIENGLEYYCGDECLHKHYTEEEYNELYDDGNGDSYWTEWEN